MFAHSISLWGRCSTFPSFSGRKCRICKICKCKGWLGPNKQQVRPASHFHRSCLMNFRKDPVPILPGKHLWSGVCRASALTTKFRSIPRICPYWRWNTYLEHERLDFLPRLVEFSVYWCFNTYRACVGQDNTNSQCTIGTVPNILVGNPGDHSGKFELFVTGTVLFLKCNRKFRSFQRSFNWMLNECWMNAFNDDYDRMMWRDFINGIFSYEML
jgi:hypothetical protein